jgi:hypothetical protein
MAKIEDLRILPPIAIGRFGSASEPLDNYTLEDDPDHPLGYRRITPAPTLVVNDAGEVAEKPPAGTIEFTAIEAGEGGERVRIRPVAPFLEVFAKVEGESELVPLSVNLLAEAGLSVEDVRWSAQVANRKVVRRTGDDDDQVSADTGWVSGHESVELRGKCANFLDKENAWIGFGHVRLIRPTDGFPDIRLRFTPPKGLIYGPGCAGPDAGCKCGGAVENDPVIPAERRVYDCRKSWYGFDSNEYEPPEGEGRLGYENATLPPSLFAISSPAPSWLNDNIAISRGYLDDACDGFVNVALTLPSGETLSASARICVGPPDVAPDSLFLRTLADDLEQVIHGPELSPDEDVETTRQRAAEIVRRAFETVRFMNVTVLNGNDIKGRSALILDSMPQEEAADTERALRPVMPPETVDTFTITALHEQVYAALRGGAAPWFDRLIRRPDEVSDFTDYGRRKMPALMCGADNSYLALTHRQIDTILKASSPARSHAGRQAAARKADASKLKARNRTAELNHVAAGNPISSRPITSVANCCPGLEMDFRAVWRRMFTGVELREYDNLVIACPARDEPGARPLDLVGHRLLRVVLPDDGSEVAFTALITGPATSDVEGQIVLTTSANPEGLAPLEWSNALATILRTYQGRTVRCDFTREPSKAHQSLRSDPENFVSHELEVRQFFDEDTAVIARALAEPGELTQGLCSPWQNDYRECSCYYWASARPDYVNVEPGAKGFSTGDNWLQKTRTGNYVPDDYLDSRLIDYDDLFRDWEKLLRFQIGGRDVPDDGSKKT